MSRGGPRRNAGRPPVLVAQLAEAKKLRSQLQVFAKAGLAVLAERFPQLMQESVAAALAGDAAERRFLIKTLLELVRPEETEETLMDKLAEQWGQQTQVTVNVGGPGGDMAREVARPPIDAEYRVVPRAE